jgi:hypothetical protein
MKFQEYARWKDSGWTPDEHLLSKNFEKYAQEPYYFHYAELPKLGMNPKQGKWGGMAQPYGIYAYPGWHIAKKAGDPFKSRKYAIVFTPKNPERVLNLGDGESLKYYKKAQEKAKNSWGSVSSGALNKELKKDYDGVVDPGLGVLHSANPTAAVFFSKKDLNLSKILLNDIIQYQQDTKKHLLAPVTTFKKKSPWSSPSHEQEALGRVRPEDMGKF